MFYSQQDCKHPFHCFDSCSSLDGYWPDRVHHSQIFLYLCYTATHLNRLFFGFFLLQVYYVRFGYISGTVAPFTFAIPSIERPRYRLSDDIWVHYDPVHGCTAIICSMQTDTTLLTSIISRDPWRRSLSRRTRSKALVLCYSEIPRFMVFRLSVLSSLSELSSISWT